LLRECIGIAVQLVTLVVFFDECVCVQVVTSLNTCSPNTLPSPRTPSKSLTPPLVAMTTSSSSDPIFYIFVQKTDSQGVISLYPSYRRANFKQAKIPSTQPHLVSGCHLLTLPVLKIEILVHIISKSV